MPAGVYFAEQASPEFPPDAIRAHVAGPCRVTVVLQESGPPDSVSIEKCPDSLAAVSLEAARESTFRLVGTKKHSMYATFAVEYPFEWHVYEQRWSIVQLTAPQITDRTFVPAGPPLVDEPRTVHVSVATRITPRYPEHARQLGVEGTCSVVVRVGWDGVPFDVKRKDCADVFYPNASSAALSSRLVVEGVTGDASARFTYNYRFDLRD